MDVPDFRELSTKNLWPRFRTNNYISDYFPDLKEHEFPEREFMYNIVNTLYPYELSKVVAKAYDYREVDERLYQEEMIELTPEMKQQIDDIIYNKSTFFKNGPVAMLFSLLDFPLNCILIATPGNIFPFLKVGAKLKKRVKEPLVFPVDVAPFAEAPKKFGKKLSTDLTKDFSTFTRSKDRDMAVEEEKKEYK